MLLFFCHLALAKNKIEDYQRTFLPVYTTEGKLLVAIRLLKMNEVPSFLIVDPLSLETKVMPVANLKPRDIQQKKGPGYFTHWNIASTRYYQLLNKSTSPPYHLENQGIIHAENDESGNILTIDLCPSTKAFESELFNKLVDLSNISKKPIPITIAISGMWLLQHQDEFQWLLKMEKQKALEITWVNHSFSHIYYKDLPSAENFLLSEGTNLDSEILMTEKYLLEEGELPSVFFRFPGLVSNESVIKKIKQYGLIPLGTDAWIASLKQKHQEITPGGIILVHGNGNEHNGIVILLPLLNKLILLDLKKSL